MKKRQKTLLRRLFGMIFLTSLTFCLWLGQFCAMLLQAQSVPPSQQVQEGVKLYQSGDYQGAITQWETALKAYQQSDNPNNAAIVKENLARVYQQIGQFDKAIAYWQPAILYYRQQGDSQQVGRLLSEEAQAYINLGQNRQAIALLCGAAVAESDCQQGTSLQIARQQGDRLAGVAALGSLGEAYRLRGDYERAIAYLQQAQQIEPSLYQFSILNSLGNTYAAIAQRNALIATSARHRGIEATARKFERQTQENTQKAGQFFRLSLENAIEQDNSTGQMRSLLNSIGLYSRLKDSPLRQSMDINQTIKQALTLLNRLPNSPEKVNAAIDLASLSATSEIITAPLAQCPVQRYLSDTQAKDLFNQALNISRKMPNIRAESFALGALGHYYECQQQYSEALHFTQEALKTTASSLTNQDSAYLWEWQTGRIFKAQAKLLQQQEKTSEATLKKVDEIAAFQRAYALLEQIRSDILLSEQDVQFDFRDTIEPVYRQLAQLRLKLASQSAINLKEKEQELTRALETIDSLRLAELQNYFGSECPFTVISQGTISPLIQDDTAVFSSIILDDNTAILLSLPNGDKKVHWLEKPRSIVEEEIKQFRQGLVYGTEEFSYDTTQAQKLYDWFIEPFESDLILAKIKTLVFIQDGIFRTIPMSALYDGKAFLLEKYAIATTPSLRVITPQKSGVRGDNALILGVTKEAKIDEQSFKSLAGISLEIQEVQTQFPNHKSLVDEQFNRKNLEQELDNSTYQIVHIATHAQFGFVREDTFLVTGDNNKIAINQLESALRKIDGGANSVELLALTACQTAAGDERAALGLAGIAVQTGVKSALASLWSVADESTLILVKEFYKNLVNLGVSKAEALQAAQLKLIKAKENPEIDDKYDNPAYWSAFILIGNWL